MSAAAGPQLSVDGISVGRGGRMLLDAVSFDVRPAEILAVVGPNGAGKTTLFEAIAGLLPPDAGEVSYEARPLSDRSSALFYLPDGIRPWAEQPVRWVLDFFAALSRTGRDYDAAEALGVKDLEGQRVGSLSKGESKRVALALALGTPQPVLLLDEPFDGLDFKQTRIASNLLRSRAAAGRTMIVSIHQLGDASRLGDQFLLLDHGRAIGEGSLEDLRRRVGKPMATLEEVFLALE